MNPTTSKTRKTLQLLKRGWLTAIESARNGGCLSLAQRVSVWRRAGVVITDKWVTTASGARIKAYRIAKGW